MSQVVRNRSFDQCVHHLFERQVERTPHDPAVVFEDDRLTFSELNARANRLARELQRRAVGPEVPVALLVERSVEMAVGLLGILKAGGAYVPLDPEQPVERQAFILKDCRSPVIVTQKHLVPRLPLHDAEIVLVECTTPLPNCSTDDENLAVDIRSEHMVYVIYTSGTTGGPKGVIIEHRHLISYLHAVSQSVDLPGGNYAMVQPLAVDSCITSIFPPWVLGGCLHILSRDRSLDPDGLLAYFERYPIDCLKIAPSHLSMILTASRPEALVPRLRLVVGGEAATWDLLDKVHTLNPECSIFNHYGPTEGTVGTSVWRYSNKAEGRLSTTPPIGHPLDGTKLYILNERLDPVTEGSIGELYIGGDQVARGYLNRPEMTSEKFIHDPFSPHPVMRIYRTGDLVQRLADGNLAFVGRRDRQVKIRGFRIEPGEVEGVLSEHSAVRLAAVEPYTQPDGHVRLAAYVVPEKGETPVAMHLLRFLRQRLPDPMVPSSVAFLEAMPRTPHGKIDRKSLPHPEEIRVSDGTVERPRNNTEFAVQEIWQEVLGIAPIGVNEDLLDLGGDSLLATTLVMRLRRELHHDVSVRTILEFPTIERLAKRLDSEVHVVNREPLPTIPRVSRDRLIPLSFSQERIWFFQHSHPQEVAYNYGVRMDFEGDLDIDALERSLAEEVRRHEIYRTTILLHQESPIQKVHPPWSVELPVLDLSMLPQDSRPAETSRQIDVFLRRPFDLGRLPLVRWKLLRLDTRHHVMIHVEHHIVHDGWSSDVFLQELFELYNAFSRGRPSPLSKPTIQYADFTCWQRNWLEEPAAAKQRNFWAKTLTGCQPHLSLPTTRPRPARQTYCGDCQITELDNKTWESLCAFGRREKATPFMVMLAALYSLLYHYTGQTDINVGTAVGNRHLPEVNSMLGMLINNLVLRVDLSDKPTFRMLLQRVRDTTMKAYDNDDLPFHHVVELVGGPRDPSRNPLFQVMFSFHDTPLPDVSVPNMTVTLKKPLNTKTAKFDLGIVVFPGAIRGVPVNIPATQGATWMNWEYNTDLFDSDIITRLIRHYHNLLKAAIEHPDRSLSMLNPLDTCERRQLLVEWNDTTADYSHNKSVHELFEHQAEQTPEAVALMFEEQQLTYTELNARANQLAHYLMSQGVGPEVPVGLCMERSVETVIGLLGILKAGGIYVPLDPAYPDKQLRFRVRDSKASILLSKEALKTRLSALGSRLVCLDSHERGWASHRVTNPIASVASCNSAYVIYTSGSTGNPKGVLISHDALANHSVVVQHHYGLQATDRVLQFAAPTFDASLEQILPTLISGATVVQWDGEVGLLEELPQKLARTRVTVANFPTAYWHVLAQHPHHLTTLAGNPALRLCIVGGEQMVPSALLAWQKRISAHVRLLNAYGPTETTITTTLFEIPPHFTETQGTHGIPIGRPLPSRECYVLNGYGNPVPVGVYGELHIGRTGLAQGYLQQPALTAEKFVPHPFSEEAGARLYKTGDVVRYRPNGTLEFKGRRDTQVKLRGYRIELGEIEAMLTHHPAVQEAVVMVQDDRPEDKRLVAYVVPADQPPVTAEVVHRHLKDKLPDYMVPANFVFLDMLPLTPNGKINRRALPAPDGSRGNLETTFVAPRAPIEAAIAAIWQAMLKLDRVGIHDDFFDLGGHSLLATQVVSRVRACYQVDLPLATLFECPTIESLAEEVENLLIQQLQDMPDDEAEQYLRLNG